MHASIHTYKLTLNTKQTDRQTERPTDRTDGQVCTCPIIPSILYPTKTYQGCLQYRNIPHHITPYHIPARYIVKRYLD